MIHKPFLTHTYLYVATVIICAEIDEACTTGNCDAITGGAYCDTASTNQCKCGAAFGNGAAGATSCTGICAFVIVLTNNIKL